jgi:DNA transposition AAA+ family ATPase
MRSDHVKTETGEEIARSLELLRQKAGTVLTMIAGAPGVGKTRALEEFCGQMGYDAIYITVASGEGRPACLGSEILGLFGYRSNGKSLDLVRRTVAAYVGRGRVLVVDEAQYLDKAGAEWLRAAAEAGEFKIVFCGDLALAELVSGIPQLQSRMMRPVHIRAVKRADVAALALDAGVGGDAVVDTLFAIARLKGALRNVDNVLSLATIFAAGDQLGLAHIKAAILDLKLGRTELAE